MKPVAWMVGASAMTWLAAVALVGTGTSVELFLGMIAPLLMASGTWVVTERTYRRRPDRLTSLMVMAFGGKLLIFGAYVTIVLRTPSLRPVPFVVSFTGYFIALHLTEALFLRRLFAGGTQDMSDASRKHSA